ncbi:hypothetical protein KUTeg_000013 [Tegillarca granosa]|uniref:Uncharacterized protein n=1 Tax=Tegillarca granosa TaxID=220873 RepID=A0ABQ9FZ03_TEGGR|nr:hypothetical protein KUTeg_000013 [Tegillarca granosa]
MKNLKTFISTEINHIVVNFSLSNYTWLCSLVVATLTFYNAQRGQEEWLEAEMRPGFQKRVMSI